MVVDVLKAWLFTLGNEVVQGRVVNTNATYLGRRLFLLGFDVQGNISLIDEVNLVAKYLKIVLSDKPSIIVTSGGLGPTYDDRTLEAVAKASERSLRLDEEALRMIEEKYAVRNMPMTEERVKMAYLPEGAVPIPNPVGTAPGSWLKVGETVIVSLPGVPRELEAMWEGWVEPRIRESFNLKVRLAERIFRVVGVPESSAAKIVKDVLKRYSNVYIKTHPKGHEVLGPVLDVYVLASGGSSEEAGKVADEVVAELVKALTSLGGRITEKPE
ncbi:MAG: competence damage-inducible protein A [Thermoprotei archaeon]|nr:MAG: competence damage-inducible protein A [Thermoprotei archaeon]